MIQLPTRDDIHALQKAMADLPQAMLQTQHYFAAGLYARELFRPKDTLIVGKVHKCEHLYIVLSGDVTIVADQKRERVRGPKVFVSQPGTKRAVYAHEDSLCITIHATQSQDLEAIERELIEPDESALFDAYNELKGLLT